MHTTEADPGATRAEIEKRVTVGAQIRMPFAVIPGDLLLLALPLATGLREHATGVLAYAAEGGFWHERVVTLSPRFTLQVIFGREFGFSYVQTTEAQALFARAQTATGNTTPAQTINGWEFDLPFLELRLHQQYAGDIGGGGALKLGFLLDRYRNVMLNDPRVGWAYGLLLKFDFEGRYYFFRP
jgi:hypothetical protein